MGSFKSHHHTWFVGIINVNINVILIQNFVFNFRWIKFSFQYCIMHAYLSCMGQNMNLMNKWLYLLTLRSITYIRGFYICKGTQKVNKVAEYKKLSCTVQLHTKGHLRSIMYEMFNSLLYTVFLQPHGWQPNATCTAFSLSWLSLF